MSNPVFGVGIVAFFLMPDEWSLVKTQGMPECLGLREAGNLQWVADGSMRSGLIVRHGEEQRTYLFQVFVESIFEGEKAERHVAKRLAKIQRNKSITLVRYGDVPSGGHQGKYMLWTRRSRAFLIGKGRMEAVLEFYIYCNITKRVLRLRLSTSKPDSMMKDAEKLISMLSSTGCHGHVLRSE
ncbi:MAG: hypothetical protein ACE5OW_01515 [Candidatus Bathyarchaeia archaeon]